MPAMTAERASRPIVVQVRADGALFTRPDFRVERVSYPMMTPTAAVGVLESIFGKPQFRWIPTRIEMLRPLQQFSLCRNETHDLPRLADAAATGRRVDTAASRDQRNALCLRDVEYRIHARIEVAPDAGKNERAYREQFWRRFDRGACFHQPYLGTREFPAAFYPPDGRPPVDLTLDLGLMPHRIHYGRPRTVDWFAAELHRGILTIPGTGHPNTAPDSGTGQTGASCCCAA